MATKVIWAADARRDVQEIVDYIAEDSPSNAAAVLTRILTATRRLEMFPKIGRVVPERGDDAVREVLVHSYRIIYQLKGRRARVVGVFHGARLIDDDLGSRI